MNFELIKNKFKRRDSSIVEKNFSKESLREAHRFLMTVPQCRTSPLIELENLSRMLGVRGIFVKDENNRCELKSFKVLGATYAISRYISEKLGIDINDMTFERLKELCEDESLRGTTFTTCSDGNHGRAVAWASSQLGFHSVIYLNKGTDDARAKGIEDVGGSAIITTLNYDDTVRYANKMAEENDWVIVQDTSWEGYQDIPLWIMRGYSKMIQECLDQMDNAKIEPTHVVIQAGVGAMAGGAVSSIVNHFRDRESSPKLIIIEPYEAACYFKSSSANDGQIHPVSGDLKSIMAGLACGEPVKEGWEVIRDYADYFVKCSDDITIRGMRILRVPLDGDRSVVSGESGAVGLGFIYEVLSEEGMEDIRDELELNEASNILVFSTEGDTAPLKYRKIIWG